MNTTTDKLDVSQLSADVEHVFETYRRTRDIFERTSAAMGRIPRYRISASTTITPIRVGDGHSKSS